MCGGGLPETLVGDEKRFKTLLSCLLCDVLRTRAGEPLAVQIKYCCCEQRLTVEVAASGEGGSGAAPKHQVNSNDSISLWSPIVERRLGGRISVSVLDQERMTYQMSLQMLQCVSTEEQECDDNDEPSIERQLAIIAATAKKQGPEELAQDFSFRSFQCEESTLRAESPSKRVDIYQQTQSSRYTERKRWWDFRSEIA